ncbi:hypothetical protein [Niveispirillum fermenti]|uniref:hypothetical protein n=1 Tax=Niveispirillum fermenti TaxID=1233113 RepID=UPI003A849420
MDQRKGLAILLICAALAGCAQVAQPPPPRQAGPPPTVAAGRGSEHGNYPTFATGEIHPSPYGPCTVYAWDRPAGDGLVVRYRSAACPAPRPGRPDALFMLDLGRALVPLADSPLSVPEAEPWQGYPVTPPAAGIRVEADGPMQ